MQKLGLLFTFFFSILLSLNVKAQTIKAPKGYSPQVGAIVSMMEDLKGRVTRSVVHLSQEEIDFLLDEKANRVGALILHLAAIEKYYQVYTFENRGFNKEEAKQWDKALDLGDYARQNYVNHPIQYYLDIWEEVRKKSLELLKTRDDKWLGKKVKGSSMNNHWAWYHVMEHQANHMGQIRLITKCASK